MCGLFCSFILDKPPGYAVFCEPETISYQKVNKPVCNTITVYLDDDDHKEYKINGDTLTFTFQKFEI